jgi:hypothetical protein
MDIDEWESIAVAQQQELINFTREIALGPMYRDGPVLPGPADVSHLYKPGVDLGGIMVRS